MNLFFKKAFITSSLAHLSIILIIFLFSLFSHFSYKKKLPVFTVYNSSSAPNTQLQPPPLPTHPPKPSTPSQSKKISYSDFLKQQSPKKSTQPAQKDSPLSPPMIKMVSTPASDLPKLASITLPPLSSQIATSSTKPNELNNYILSLKNHIDLEWQKPTHTHGYTQEAIIQFTINPNGSLQSFKLIQPSGSTEFDASIEQAFAVLTFFPPPPKEQSYTFELAFNLQ